MLVLLVFNFTLFLDEVRALELGPGILWVAFVFAGMLALGLLQNIHLRSAATLPTRFVPSRVLASR